MKKCFNVILMVLLLTFVFQGCDNKDPIRIGVVGTMTGTQSDLSVSGRRGIEIAVKEVNDNGGINGRLIEMVVKDDMNDVIRANEIVKEFVEEDIKIVIGHYTSGMMLAAYDEVVKNDILYLSPTVSSDNLSESDDNFIRFIASTKEQAQVINKVAMDSGDKEFLVIFDEKNIGYNQYLFSNFESLLIKNGGKILEAYSYESLNQNAIEEIIKLITDNNQADALFVISNASDTGTIAQEIRKSGSEITIYGSLWSRTLDLIQSGGEFVEGTKVVSGIDLKSELTKYISFTEKFEKRYGRESTFCSVYSYETCMTLVKAIQEVDNITAENIKNKIISIGSFEGLQQTYFIDEFGDNTREFMMDEVIDGSFVRIE